MFSHNFTDTLGSCKHSCFSFHYYFSLIITQKSLPSVFQCTELSHSVNNSQQPVAPGLMSWPHDVFTLQRLSIYSRVFAHIDFYWSPEQPLFFLLIVWGVGCSVVVDCCLCPAQQTHWRRIFSPIDWMPTSLGCWAVSQILGQFLFIHSNHNSCTDFTF